MFDPVLMKRAAAALATTADEGGESAPARVGSPMRGWQWKVLQGQQQQALQSWMPRLVRSEATPLTQLLASPGKQSLIGAGIGGLLGGGAGVAAGQLVPKYLPGVNLSPEHQGILAAGGLGLGALLGASKAYGARRRQNDRIIDALRRTPPGATVRDYEALQQADADQKLKL